MAIIYKITNKVNGKVYIGQTKTPLNQRMNKHYSRANCIEDITGIDAAIRKYGKENFDVEIIDTCTEEQLDDLERFYIAKYDSYENGYNLTRGGQDGIGSKLNIDVDAAYQIYLREKSMKKAAKIIGCSDKTLSNLFRENGKDTTIFQMSHVDENLKKGADLVKRKVRIVELNKKFDSITECGQWLIDNGYSKATPKTARYCIARVLNGQRQTYLKMHYEAL